MTEEGGKGHGHDAPPLGSRLRGNDGLGEGTTMGGMTSTETGMTDGMTLYDWYLSRMVI